MWWLACGKAVWRVKQRALWMFIMLLSGTLMGRPDVCRGGGIGVHSFCNFAHFIASLLHFFSQLLLACACWCPLLSMCNCMTVHNYCRTIIFNLVHASQRSEWFFLCHRCCNAWRLSFAGVQPGFHTLCCPFVAPSNMASPSETPSLVQKAEAVAVCLLC